MQKTHQFPTLFARLASVICAQALTPPMPESYSVGVPGRGSVGCYPTIADAETALLHLPLDSRQRAEIYDQDGYCVVR